MAIDTDLFWARRLGVGLRMDEKLPAEPREWALGQLQSVPPYGFLDETGKDIEASLPDYAQRTTTNEAGARKREALEEAMNRFRKASRNMSPQEANEHETHDVEVPFIVSPVWRTYVSSALTAINGQSGVFERFFMFWTNHFTVFVEDDLTATFIEPHRLTIRNRMTGKFADLLYEAVINPSILIYLDNQESTGPHARAAGTEGHTSLNENLGRELLELYSLSPAAGYTQEDVTETALTLTGWAYYAGSLTGSKGKYGRAFKSELHEPGARKILGKTYPPRGNGANQIRDLINDLAVHPATAKHLAFKLARAFIADDPPQDSVDRIAKAFLDTGGDMIALHSATVEEVLAVGAQYRKMTTPENWIAQAYRVSGAHVPISAPGIEHGRETIHLIYGALGQPICAPAQPNGFSDLKADWISREMLDRRVRQAYRIGAATYHATQEAVTDYAARLAGSDSPLVTAVNHAESLPIAMALVLASAEFLTI
jgi:uncharacterized protein (DUF1800 family)